VAYRVEPGRKRGESRMRAAREEEYHPRRLRWMILATALVAMSPGGGSVSIIPVQLLLDACVRGCSPATPGRFRARDPRGAVRVPVSSATSSALGHTFRDPLASTASRGEPRAAHPRLPTRLRSARADLARRLRRRRAAASLFRHADSRRSRRICALGLATGFDRRLFAFLYLETLVRRCSSASARWASYPERARACRSTSRSSPARSSSLTALFLLARSPTRAASACSRRARRAPARRRAGAGARRSPAARAGGAQGAGTARGRAPTRRLGVTPTVIDAAGNVLGHGRASRGSTTRVPSVHRRVRSSHRSRGRRRPRLPAPIIRLRHVQQVRRA